MARPKAKETKIQYTVMLHPSLVQEIDKLAEKLDLSRSQFMANLIESGLDDAKILYKLGILDIFKLSGKLGAKLKRDALKENMDNGAILKK